jgi:RND family efflux transporter MFP subunit
MVCVQNERTMMNRTAAAGLLLILLLLAGCSRESKKAEAATTKAPEPVAVQTVQAQSRLLDTTIAVTGSLNPDESVAVSAEVPGRVQAVHFDFGQYVRNGQVVAELDKQELSISLERAEASLAQALARLGLDPGQESVRPESTPSIRQAQAQMEDAKSKFENASRLVKSGDISQERFIEAQKAYEARTAVYEAARDDARTLSAQVQALQAEVKLAQKRLSDATLRAPFDGEVSQRHVSPGQYIKENTPILTVVKTNPLRLRVEIPETAAGAVGVGTTLTFTTSAVPDARFAAVVRELNPSLDSRSRTLTAEARLNSGDRRLRPGMFVQVELVLEKSKNAVVVPKRALYSVAGLTKMFTVKDGRVIEHKVMPGQETDGWVEVPGDQVQPGDQVAVSALTQLVQGTPVKPRG